MKVSRTDKLIDLASLGLVAFIIFTLIKSFKDFAGWLGGAGETIQKVRESFKEIISPEPIQVPEGGSAEVTYQPPIPTAPPISARVEHQPEKITVEETVPLPSPIFPIVPYIPFKIKKTIPKPPEKAKVHPKPVDIRKLHREHPAITKSVPSKSFTDYMQKVKSKPKELQLPGVERIIAKLP